MGLGGLYPIDVMLRNQVTPVGGNYFIFSAGSTKDALVVEKSEGLMKWFALEKPGWAPQLPSDDRIVLSQAALEGPEVWADTRLAQAFFFSDHLVRAMRKAKIATKFRLFQCRIE